LRSPILIIKAPERRRRRARFLPLEGRARIAHLSLDRGVLPAAVTLGSAAVLGLAVTVSPKLAAALAGVAALSAIALAFDVLGIGIVLTATLPWLIVLSDVLPRLTLTLAAGATALAVVQIALPRGDNSRASSQLRIGIALFFAPIAISLARDGLSTGLSQAAKYVVFPLMVLAVTEGTNRSDLLRLRWVALWSSATAVSFNLALGLTGVANIHYYGTGEILGLGSEHVLALLAGCVTAATLASGVTLAWSPVVAMCAVATVATGVRSVLPGLALAGLTRMIFGHVRFRMIILVAVAIFGIFASGAAHVVEARFHRGQSLGEFRSFDAFGSGRGAIYSAALDGWRDASPIDWVTGTGLRSILRFEQERLGETFVGHSDVIEVGVQLGIVGLMGLLLMWRVLIVRANSKLPLLVLGSFALFNGVLEYSGPVVIAVLLTAGLRSASEVPERVQPRRIQIQNPSGPRLARQLGET
jgi:hypothetical protein